MNTVNQFIENYKSGQRLFEGLEFENGESLHGQDLRNSTFIGCYLSADFPKTDLRECKFLNCNLKTSDFNGADLRNAVIKECAVEATSYQGANVEGLIFENNSYYGLNLQQEDFIKLLDNK